MSRDAILAEIKDTLGLVPGFFEDLPADTLEGEWGLFKRFELADSTIPLKYRELIGVAVAAATHCWYCTNFHGDLARFHGAAEAEVQEAVHLAKFGVGWSTYLNGRNYDRDRFLGELADVGRHLSKQK
ncbi:MAG: carboxymuconolactone decarboxylase family protein [Myxococcota bacterium]